MDPEKNEMTMIEHGENTVAAPDKITAVHEDVRVRQKGSKEERRLVRKQDLLILPLLSGSIFFAYLDRGQIGNARIMGMQKDVGLSDQQYYNCLMMFFLGYMLVELPAGILLRIAPPRFVIGGAVLCFGVFAASIASVKSYGPLLVLRILLGFAEGVGYNIYLYTSQWYKPHEMVRRTAAVFGMSPIAGAISGIIAYGVQKNLNGANGIASWRWLFLIEGVITVSFSLLIIAFLPQLPDTVVEKGHLFFRGEDERRIISQRSHADDASLGHMLTSRFMTAQNTSGTKPRYHQILIAFKDPKLWLGSLMMGGWGLCVGAFGVFLPTFINQFGFNTLETQLYSMIPYAFGFVALIMASYLSPYIKNISFIVLGSYFISIVGFIILLATTNTVALMAGLCFVLIGVYPGTISTVAWVVTFHGGFVKRATAIWTAQVFIQGYSIIATQVYTTPPRFYKGHGIGLALCFIAMASTVALYFIMSRENAKRDRRARELEASGDVDEMGDKTFEDLCDFHPAWRYAL